MEKKDKPVCTHLDSDSCDDYDVFPEGPCQQCKWNSHPKPKHILYDNFDDEEDEMEDLK